MANESQYYNPIIEAMIATANSARLKADQEQKKKEFDTESKQKDQQLKQHQQQIDQEHQSQLKQHEIAFEQLGIQKKLADLQATKNRLDSLEGIQKLIRSGADPNVVQKFPGLFAGMGQSQGANYDFSQPSKQSQLEGIGIAAPQEQIQQPQVPDFGGIYNPETEAANIKREAEAKSKGTAEGALDSQKKLIDYEAEAKKKLQDSENVWKSTENKLDRQSHEYLGRLQASAHLQAAGLGMGSSSSLKGMVQAGLTGRVKLDGSNPLERAAMGAIFEGGAKPLDPKEIDTLRQSQQLSPIFDKLDAFADKLAQHKETAALTGLALGAARKVGYTPDIQNEINILKSQALNIGKALEGMTGGRVLLSQMQLDLDSFAAGNITRDQMKDRIKNLRDFYINKVDDMYLQGVPTAQRLILFHDQGIMPGYVATAPKVHPEHPDAKLDVEASIKEGEPVYKRSKK